MQMMKRKRAQNALWFLLRCLILFPSFLIPFLQCVVFIDLHLFIVATCDFVGSFLVLLRIVISAVLPHSISHEAIQREKTAAKEGGKALSPCDRCGDCSTGRWATNNDIKPSPTPGIGPDRSQSPEPYYSKTLGRFFAVSVPLGEGKARYTDDTTSVWFDSKAEYLYVSLDPEANAKDSDTVSAAAYPRIQLRDRNDKTVDREQEKYGEPLGHSHIEWEGIYKPMETFELPTWTTLPERHTLEHASVFVSIAAFRDKECAGTLHSVLSRARSRHRIYAGISEERRDADVDCLSLLELQNQKRSRELLWGEEAPRSVSFEKRHFTWEDILAGRDIDLISSVVKSAKVTNLSSPSEANYTKTPCQCTGSSRTYFECSEVKKEQTPGCLEGLNQTLSVCLQNEGANASKCMKEHDRKLYACSDEEYAIECIKSNSTVAAELFKHESGENVKQITDAKDQPFWCIESGGNHYCSDGSDAPGDGGESDNDCHCDENTGPVQSAIGVDATAALPGGVFLDTSYKKDSITCIAGNVESARDEFLLALHNRLPQSHKRYSSLKLYMDSLSTDTILLLRENFPLRVGRGLQQQPVLGDPHTAGLSPVFYFNQDYYMVVDSHSRFSVHWDNKMILRIYQLPTSGVLSHYPNGYLPESPEGEFDKNEVMGMCKGQILANGMPKLGANWMPLRPHPTLEAFAAAGYLFGDAQFALDTPFDPFLSYLFDGEEILYSVRMWTHGWDIYCPAESNVFHFYGRPDAPKFWSLMTVSKRKIQTISEQRALYLMERAQPWIQDKHRYGKDPEYIPPNKRRLVTEAAAKATPRISIWKEYYGMGTNRTLEQFWDYAQLSDKYVVSKDNEDRWEGLLHSVVQMQMMKRKKVLDPAPRKGRAVIYGAVVTRCVASYLTLRASDKFCLLRCLILFPSFLIPFLQCVVFIDLHLFIVATCDFVGSFLVLLRIVISAVLPHSISHEAIQREKTAAKEGGGKRFLLVIVVVIVLLVVGVMKLRSKSPGSGAESSTIRTTVKPDSGATVSFAPITPPPVFPAALGRFFAVSVPLGEGKARYTDDTTSVWFDSKAEYLYVSLDPEANAKDSDTVSAAAYPRIQLRDRNDKTVDREQEKYGEPLGHSHIEWEGIYMPSETFELPTWTTLPERHTLEHASVFVSIAAFRDEECASTLHNIFEQSRSPHRIYAGISEERRDADVDCLSLLELQNRRFSRELLWGEEAPRSVSFEKRHFTWEDILAGRDIDLISSVVKSAKVTNLSSPSEANYTKTPCQCTGSSRTYFECSEVKKEQTPGCLEGLNQTLSVCLQNEGANASKCMKEHDRKLYACSDEEYAIECIKSNSTINLSGVLKAEVTITVLTGPMRRVTVVSQIMTATAMRTRAPFLDTSYKKDSITCIAGNVESARDEFLLALHNRLPQSHKRYSSLKLYMDSLSTDTILLLRENFPLRVGRGLQQQPVLGDPHTAGLSPVFYFNQDYYMVVDSHSRFSVHWDNKMILRIYQLPTSGVLSHYPNGYLPESPEGEFDKNEVMGMCKGQILANGMPKLGANWMPLRPHPTLEAFAAAGYLFGDAQFALDTPFDPFLSYLFDGEEILYSARMWTHGWDIYCPAESNVFHMYERRSSPSFWTLMTTAKERIQLISEQRALYLMERAQPWVKDKHRYGKDPEYIPPNKRRLVTEASAKIAPRISAFKEYYGMGTNRTLEQFWDFSQLSDKYVVSRDAEGRWEGGQDLLRKKFQTVFRLGFKKLNLEDLRDLELMWRKRYPGIPQEVQPFPPHFVFYFCAINACDNFTLSYTILFYCPFLMSSNAPDRLIPDVDRISADICSALSCHWRECHEED
eukprot:gene6610-4730_t